MYLSCSVLFPKEHIDRYQSGKIHHPISVLSSNTVLTKHSVSVLHTFDNFLRVMLTGRNTYKKTNENREKGKDYSNIQKTIRYNDLCHIGIHM